MYLPADEARSDVILTGAATVFGGVLLSLLLSAPGVPTSGAGGDLVLMVGWFALSGLVPLLLARYRDDVPGAFGLAAGHRIDATAAASLAAPVIVLGLLRGLLIDGNVVAAVLGRPGRSLVGSPVVGSTEPDVLGAILALVGVVVLTVGALLLVGFLVVRGRDAFRADEGSSTEVLRTFGAGAAGAALLFGGLRALFGGASFTTLVLNVVALVAVLLVADRLVPPGAVIARSAVLTPVVLVVVAHVFAAGGIFRGELLLGLSSGALAGGTTLAIAVVGQHRRTTAVALPLLLAVHWWPTCLSPLPFTGC
ncbi:MAG: hypothetical protein WEB09_07975 [Nitriliruptor sp.]